MKYRYRWGEMLFEVVLERDGDRYRATINGETFEVDLLDTQPGAFTLRFPGEGRIVKPQTVYWGSDGDVRWLSAGGCTYRLDRPRERARTAGGPAASESLRAPMPAQVRAVQVAEGDEIEDGQTLMLLEAMKMEIRLQAPRAGRIARLLAQVGDTVERDQLLVELEPES